LEVWYTGNWWAKHLTKHILFWALNEWQKRNERLHKDVDKREKEKKRNEKEKEIALLYEQQERKPKARLKKYFLTPIIERLQQNPARQKQWIESIRALNEKTILQNGKNRN
jgi:hypothetical protein